MFRILVVEDDGELRRMFCRVLERNGFTALGATDGVSALELMEREYIDLIVSDVMMPRMDGCGLVDSLRQTGNQVPVLMITAREDFQEMQRGFLAGADDYMVKPINVNELVLRIHALLRRAQMVAQRCIRMGQTELLYDALSVRSPEGEQLLPQKEFMLLYKLAAAPGQIFTRQQLMDDIWGYETQTDPRTVDVHINRLRDRFRNQPDFSIVTVRGIGYKVVKKE